jgi:hypothetical protein
MEVFGMIQIELTEEVIQGSQDGERFDLTLIDLLVAVFAESTGSVEHIPGLKESVITNHIGIVLVQLEDLILHIRWIQDRKHIPCGVQRRTAGFYR